METPTSEERRHGCEDIQASPGQRRHRRGSPGGFAVQERTIQLLESTEGELAGGVQVRFCHDSPGGACKRSPLILDERDIAEPKQALKPCPRLHRLSKKPV